MAVTNNTGDILANFQLQLAELNPSVQCLVNGYRSTVRATVSSRIVYYSSSGRGGQETRTKMLTPSR